MLIVTLVGQRGVLVLTAKPNTGWAGARVGPCGQPIACMKERKKEREREREPQGWDLGVEGSGSLTVCVGA